MQCKLRKYKTFIVRMLVHVLVSDRNEKAVFFKKEKLKKNIQITSFSEKNLLLICKHHKNAYFGADLLLFSFSHF